MSTTTADVREEHLSKEEVEKLAHPKRPMRQRVGVVFSYIGMGLIVLYCIIPFYWMIVSSLRQPSEGLSTELIPSPASVENYKAVFESGVEATPEQRAMAVRSIELAAQQLRGAGYTLLAGKVADWLRARRPPPH